MYVPFACRLGLTCLDLMYMQPTTEILFGNQHFRKSSKSDANHGLWVEVFPSMKFGSTTYHSTKYHANTNCCALYQEIFKVGNTLTNRSMCPWQWLIQVHPTKLIVSTSSTKSRTCSLLYNILQSRHFIAFCCWCLCCLLMIMNPDLLLLLVITLLAVW